MFFNGHGYQRRLFEEIYRCYPASFIEKPQIENGDKIIMPPSALERLASLHIEYPMLFELRSGSSERVSHCGVLEFIADEGTIYMPYWMMQNMLLQEGDTVRVKSVSIPKGTYVKLQPHTKDFLDISNPKATLETTLRNFSCLTTGDTILVTYNNKNYYIDVIETKPTNAVSIIDTDCEVDFAPSLDYKAPSTASKDNLNPFFGTGRRLDGKPSSVYSASAKDKGTDAPNVNSMSCAKLNSASLTRPSQGKLVFGSDVFRTKEIGKVKGKTESKQEPPHQNQPKFQPFFGKKYSLRG